jgi:hypothetical protein
MDQTWQRVLEDLVARVTGPLHFRIVMQPTMAILLAIRDGWKDARAGNPAYFWAIFTKADERKRLLKEGFSSLTKVLGLALVLDGIYQLIELHWFYFGEAIIVALLLAFVPYLLIRGPANRLSRWWFSRHRNGETKKQPPGEESRAA